MENVKSAVATFWASIVARTWEDEDFKNKLIKDPKGELEKIGYDQFSDPNGEPVQIEVKETSSDYEPCVYENQILTIYLPKKPDCLTQLAFKGQFMAGMCS